jgi:hypothetical protein
LAARRGAAVRPGAVLVGDGDQNRNLLSPPLGL